MFKKEKLNLKTLCCNRTNKPR